MIEKVIELLEDIIPDFDRENEALVDSGEMTSLSVLQLIAAIDDELDVQIPPSDIRPENFNSVRSIAAVIEKNMEE
ncbi:MAG: acyl carrier protein [Clostridia bacterium]|nr:acyl carrier protein [Clostridia bacterium]